MTERKEVSVLPELGTLLDDIRILTLAENQVIRGGNGKDLSRSLLFFCAENVATAYYTEGGKSQRLYDLDIPEKPCELGEAQVALENFANAYKADPASVPNEITLEVLSELSDVFYNLAQLVDNRAFESIVRSFSTHHDLFAWLLVIAKAKYSYRYLNVNNPGSWDLVSVGYSASESIILENVLPQRRKDPGYEVEEVIGPLFEGAPEGFATALLVNNWDHIGAMLGSVYSTARTVALELDGKNEFKKGDERGLEGQLVRALRKVPSLESNGSV